MGTRLRFFVMGIFLTCWVLCAHSQSSAFQFLNKPGRYPVGLKVVKQFDVSRFYPAASDTSTGEGHRPLQTLIWYPSTPNQRETLTVEAYVRLADSETQFAIPDQATNKWRARLQTTFHDKLRAVRDAEPENGRYPVLIYAPSDSGVAWENADLCEYLASQGYVVLASPSMGKATRDMTDDLEGINTQASDISFLIGYAASLPNANLEKVAVVSWSYGGISSLFAAARDPRIDALVALDGSQRYYPGLVQKAGDVHPEHMTLPMMFFMQGDISLEALAQDDAPSADRIGPSVLNAWGGDLYSVHMLGMSHPEFSSMSQRRKTAERYREDQIADYDRADTNTGYALVALYATNFLNWYLKRDPAAKAFLQVSPQVNGAPRHFMGVSFRPARGGSSTGH